MTGSGFYRLGRLAGSKFLKAKWMWESAAGNEAEAIRAEHGVGRTMAEAIRERTRCDSDPQVRAQLNDVLARLADRVGNPLHRFEVTSTDEPEPTAFALPGGFIFVTRALVDICEADDDELAFVIAHEMSHVIRRHAIERLLGQTAVSAAARALPTRGVLVSLIQRVGVDWLERAYSQDQEFEADELGGRLARAAGFDAGGAVRALRRFEGRLDSSGDSGLGVYLSTHPPIDERVARLRERLGGC